MATLSLEVKSCKRCGETKPVSAFSIKRDSKDGYRYYCKPCTSEFSKESAARYPDRVKDGYYRKTYGISLAEYNEMFANQDGKCAICRQIETAKNKSLAVDHHPVTGVVRSLLCHKCNAGLGHFNDDKLLLLKAAQYLDIEE